jgi:hypothetical protein
MNYMLPECRRNITTLSLLHKWLSRPDIMGLKGKGWQVVEWIKLIQDEAEWRLLVNLWAP